MKQVITFKITGARASGVLLLHLVVVLHQLHLNPVALSWERGPAPSDVGVGMLVVPKTPKLDALLEALRATDGFREVVIEFPSSEADSGSSCS